MAASLDTGALDDLNSQEARELHSISNNLRSYGVDKFVKLPEIIVVGQQSVGKSSVLEAISHVRFPVESSLCTRFPTELILRRSNTPSVNVSIQYADPSKDAHVFEKTDFKPEDLPVIIEEAKPYMGISPDGRGFSKDILRLEVEGPQMQPLTLIDLPGLYATGTATQSLADKDLVNELVLEYMKKENSIILVVVDAVTQLANQSALQAAKDLDKTRERTLGVITKPDRIVPGSDEEADWVRVAKNMESANRLNRGWHVLRNRASKEASLEQRDALEDRFFQSGAWATIPVSDRGVGHLRVKLGRIMFDHLRKGLPEVLTKIEKRLEIIREDLKRLGQPRTTKVEKTSFLLKIAEDFKKLATDGINGWYNDSFFGELDDGEHKLRAKLRNFNHTLDYIMRTKGHTTVLESDAEAEERIRITLPDDLGQFLADHPYHFQDPEVVSKEDMYYDLRNKASKNRGLEFPGTPNQALVVALFRDQAKSWQTIAECHVKLVQKESREFVEAIFDHIVASPGVMEELKSQFVDTFFEAQNVILHEKVCELWAPYKDGVSLPVDVNLVDAASKLSLRESLLEFSAYLRYSTEEDSPVLRVDQFLGERLEDHDEFGLNQIYSMMCGYYESSRRTFTDNIINLAVESCLIRNLPKILTPTQVIELDDEQLDLLASESDLTISRRQILLEEQETLRKGSDRCSKLRRHRNKGTPETPSTPPQPASNRLNITPATSDEAGS